ncbi:hypothetical protein F0562_015572 [Nyssa sinensis]|uniref:Uncharacterized protein n=1 Tax=Nyssa sinensis TaxID=561372 RepID=A0A5J4ZKL7_9ASTE|nr:hypothetical protein F0562_015572 [Nyssa sinensis]
MPDQISSSTALVQSCNSNPHIWRLRLGHVPSARLQIISNLDSSIKVSPNHESKKKYTRRIRSAFVDIMLNRTIKDALVAEEKFFHSCPVYSDLADRCGIPQLAKKLNQILVHHIKTVLPGLKSRISAALVSVAKEHASYGEITESKAPNLVSYCAYLDVENAVDPFLAESMGVDTENLLISQPDSAENLLSVVDTLTKSGSIDVIVVDSVAALVPQCELDFQISGTYKDIQSQIMNQALRKIHYSLCCSRTLIIFVNQVRLNLKSGQGFGPTDEVEDEVTGLGICVQVVKNKLACDEES